MSSKVERPRDMLLDQPGKVPFAVNTVTVRSMGDHTFFAATRAIGCVAFGRYTLDLRLIQTPDDHCVLQES